jgi:hypothetical protein
MGTIAQKGTYHGIRYADLQSKGARCWFASEDMKIGDRLHPRIDETIRLYNLKDARKLCRSFRLLKKQWLASMI